jgi:uncharacterized membrane protein YeaQ/YmgE (transglycosylase-associated protein family)
MLILIFSCIILGVLAGVLASKVITGHGQGFVMDMVFGIGGALIGGCLSRSFGTTRLNVWTLLGAVVGAVVLLGIWHVVRHRAFRA